MLINEILAEKGMSKYRLSKESGVPQATVRDICNGKTNIEKCSAGTLYKIARVLEVPMESILIEAIKESEHRPSFELYKSSICHRVKDMGDIDFMLEVLEENKIRKLYNKGWYPEAFYLLGMLDYLSRVNDVPICTSYNDIRCCKLKETVYPEGILMYYAVMKEELPKEEILQKAIPEFLRFNIVESDIRNVY